MKKPYYFQHYYNKIDTSSHLFLDFFHHETAQPCCWVVEVKSNYQITHQLIDSTQNLNFINDYLYLQLTTTFVEGNPTLMQTLKKQDTN